MPSELLWQKDDKKKGDGYPISVKLMFEKLSIVGSLFD